MTPEIAVILQRASARRTMLAGLLDALPLEYWERRAPGDAWSVRDHVAHLAVVDRPFLPLLAEAAGGAFDCWLGGRERGALIRTREANMDSMAGLEIGALRAALGRARADVEGALSALPAAACDMLVHIPDATGPWGEPVALPLRNYLVSWAEHDGVHEAAIRRAILTLPDLVTVMFVRAARSG